MTLSADLINSLRHRLRSGCATRHCRQSAEAVLDGQPERLSHLVAPTEATNLFTDPFAHGAGESLDLAENYREIAETRDCYFMAASQHIKSSDIDGVH